MQRDERLSFFDEWDDKNEDMFPPIDDFDEKDLEYFRERRKRQDRIRYNKPKLLPEFIWNAVRNRSEDPYPALNLGCGRIEINGKFARIFRKIFFALLLNLIFISPFIYAVTSFNQGTLIRRVCYAVIYDSIFLLLPFIMWVLIESNRDTYVPPRPSKKKSKKSDDDYRRYFNPFENVDEFTKPPKKPTFGGFWTPLAGKKFDYNHKKQKSEKGKKVHFGK